MGTLSLRIEPQNLSLSVTDFPEEETDRIMRRLNDLKPLLEEILSFDDTISELSDDEYAGRLAACSAMDLKYQVLLSLAIDQASLARKIAEGSERISDHGFPEFEHI